MKKFLFLIFLIILLSFSIVLIPKSNATDNTCDISNVQNSCSGTNGFGSACQDLLNKCESSINQALQDSINATAPLQSKLDSLNNQIQGIKDTVLEIEVNLAQKKKDINTSYAQMAKQTEILNATIRDYYIKSYYNSPLLILLSTNSVSQFTQILGLQKANADRDKAIITNIAITILGLQNKQKELQAQEASLTALKQNLDSQSAQLDKIISGAKSYQTTLSNQLASLNSIQQNIIAAKLSGLNIPLTAYAGMGGGCSSDVGKDPGFGGSKFGFFTYGVPNRVGLNQYGAKGRAAKQDYKTILNAYYNFSWGTSGNPNIHVVGTNNYGQNIDMNLTLEEYLQHIYEMPASWPSEALKAQVVAARSYVLAYTNNGEKSICPSDHCQEFKNELNSQAWIDAVNATAGQIMTSNGSPISAWFSSTHGGYVHASGGDVGGAAWTKNAVDTTSGSAGSFSDLNNNAYDKDSPWFYCDWGSRSSYNGTAWLQSSEVADIVNVLLLAQKDSSTVNHLYQPDKANPAGTDTWDASRVRSELSSRGITPYNSISSASVSVDFGSGNTNNISFTGDAGSVSFSGSDFKNYFNLRAPSNIQIVGPLYNVER